MRSVPHGNPRGGGTIVRPFVLVGAILVTAGILAAAVVSVHLSNVQRTHDSLCAGPAEIAQASFCRSVENEIHVFQGLMYISLLTAGGGLFLLALGVVTHPRKPAPLSNRGYAAHR